MVEVDNRPVDRAGGWSEKVVLGGTEMISVRVEADIFV